MANKKSGRIAVPFLVTIFLGLLLVGGAAWYILKMITKEEAPPEPPARSGGITITEEDSHTILFILDTPDQNSKYSFMVMRSVPIRKKILFIGVPANMTAVIDDTQKNLSDEYAKNSTSGAMDFVSRVFGIEIDRYMKLDSEAFQRICDMLGGVTYPIDVDVPGLQADGTEQTMNAKQIETYITYAMFDDGEEGRATNSAYIIQKMINGTDTGRIADNIDRYYEEIINMNGHVDTDITSVDYQDRIGAIKSMLNYHSTEVSSSMIASATGVDGKTYEGDFLPSASFINNLPNEFFGTGDEE